MSIRAVVFDWAGTVVDFGCCAPVEAFQAAFRSVGFEVSREEAREPMGMAKRDHIKTVLEMPQVSQRWLEQMGRPVDEAAVDQIFERFLPLQAETIARHSTIIDGVKQTVEFLRANQIGIGSSTGYTRELMDQFVDQVADAGFRPDFITTASDPCLGRPAPWMIYRNCEALGVYPMRDVVKVDDTLVGIEAGRNAGCWTVGVMASGNLMGLPQAEFDALADQERRQRLAVIEQRFRDAGADEVVGTVAELPECMKRLNRRMES
jgi:phosphonoacetaldehyde hydrolase